MAVGAGAGGGDDLFNKVCQGFDVQLVFVDAAGLYKRRNYPIGEAGGLGPRDLFSDHQADLKFVCLYLFLFNFF